MTESICHLYMKLSALIFGITWPLAVTSVLAIAAPSHPVLRETVHQKSPPLTSSNASDAFEQQVRPLLIEHCGGCHASSVAKAGVILDTAEGVRKVASRLAVVLGATGKPTMPPGLPLLEVKRNTLILWAKNGAHFPAKASISADKAWYFKPVSQSPVPAIQGTWIRNDIDRYVLSSLRKAGLKPQPEADRRKLIRRVSYDLIGLPPRSSDVESFLADNRPDAYERVVDSLLARPEYGQRWGRHWLDVVRYADSQDARGIGGSSDFAEAYKYRDWVVDAFNTDMPWATFVANQLAGDTFRTPDGDLVPSSVIATGWLAFGNWGNGDADKDKILTDIVDDQVDTMSKTFLGVTVGCARCHNHKFDPISQRDYTALSGIFYSTHILPKLTPKGAGEDYLRIPIETKADREGRVKRDALVKQIADERSEAFSRAAIGSKTQTKDVLEFIMGLTQKDPNPLLTKRWKHALGLSGFPRLANITQTAAGISGLDSLSGPEGTPNLLVNRNSRSISHVTFTVDARSIALHPGPRGGVRFKYNGGLSGTYRHEVTVRDADAGCGDGIVYQLVLIQSNGEEEILSKGEIGNGAMDRRDVVQIVRPDLGIGARVALDILPKGEYSCDTTNFTWSIQQSGRTVADAALDAMAAPLGNPFGPSADPGRWSVEDLARKPGSELPQALRDAVVAKDIGTAVRAASTLTGASHPAMPWGMSDLPLVDQSKLASYQNELIIIAKAVPLSSPMAVGALEGGVPESPHAGIHDVKIHKRGRYDDLGELVPRGIPSTFLSFCEALPVANGSGRPELAKWIGDTRNLHVSRVWVNRVWMHHFGQGIVRTPSNFGALGDRPSHPELLNYLALYFQRHGQSTKELHRLLVSSAAYRQQSTPSRGAQLKDPENRLLSHMNRRLLDAESLRDTWLSVAGLLDVEGGGPSITAIDSGQRTIYLQTVRSDRTSYRMLFDGADPTSSIEKRNVSIVAPQALYLLNSSFTDSVTSGLVRQLERMPGSYPKRILSKWETMVGRNVTAGERDAFGDLWNDLTLGNPALSSSERLNVIARTMLCANATAVVD